MAAPELEVMRSAYEALVSGDFPVLFDLMADDVNAHVPGRSPIAGDYVGKEAVGGYVAKLGELSGGTLRFELHTLVAGDGHGVAWVRDLAERGTRALAMNNVHLWHVADGKLREIWIYPGDQYDWDDFWS